MRCRKLLGNLSPENEPLAMPKILYIEDTENNRILITRRLGQSGYEVVTAENAEQGMAVARAEKPDLILMDMGLPEVDGWSATRRLKEDPELKDIPVVALTAHVMHGDREKALAAGCDDYDTKPFQFTRLLGKIEILLAKPETRNRRGHEGEQHDVPTEPASLKDKVAEARHDLCNPLGNILGFCEILLQPDQPRRRAEVKMAVRAIDESACKMVAALKQVLDPDKFLPSPAEVKTLEAKLGQHAALILRTNQMLLEKAAATKDARLREDLARMLESAQRVVNLIGPALSFYREEGK